MSGDAVDDHIKTAISLLQVANSAMSILSLGSGMSGQMKLLTTGLGLLRSATLLADDGQLASAGKQVTRAVDNMAGLATQIGALLGNTANLVSEQGNPQMASALTSMSGALGNVGDQLGNLEDILDKLGFNTGNISSGNASIQAGLDSLSDAAQDLGKAADDFDKSLDILKTDSALTSATLGHMVRQPRHHGGGHERPDQHDQPGGGYRPLAGGAGSHPCAAPLFRDDRDQG